jgi:hypothetical protein
MTMLSDFQQKHLKAARALAWTRPFEIVTEPSQSTEDYYDTPPGTPPAIRQTVMGDWAWGPGLHYTGQYGLMVPDGTVLLCTDICCQEAVEHPRARLMIDGIVTAVVRVTRYPEFGEIVIQAKRVDPPVLPAGFVP